MMMSGSCRKNVAQRRGEIEADLRLHLNWLSPQPFDRVSMVVTFTSGPASALSAE